MTWRLRATSFVASISAACFLLQTLTNKTLAAATAASSAVVARGAAGQAAPLVLLRDSAGAELLRLHADGAGNTAAGRLSLHLNTDSIHNTALGAFALRANTDGFRNTAVGSFALFGNTTGDDNTALGRHALFSNTTGFDNTALGAGALFGTNFSNTTGLGAGSAVTGNNQVQLGNSATTAFYYQLQQRSDARDKADVRGTVLGLGFIRALRPVDFRWDLRDDYRPEPPEAPGEGATEAERAAFEAELAAWREAGKLGNLRHDGTRKRARFHHGLVAQEVAALIERTGVDFGGYQDHAVKGGDDALSLGYAEFVAPLIKAW